MGVINSVNWWLVMVVGGVSDVIGGGYPAVGVLFGAKYASYMF